jgi:hypothetical protein
VHKADSGNILKLKVFNCLAPARSVQAGFRARQNAAIVVLASAQNNLAKANKIKIIAITALKGSAIYRPMLNLILLLDEKTAAAN